MKTPKPNPGWRTPWQFTLASDPPAPLARTEENELERLKNQLLRDALARVANASLTAPVRRAANEAAALAWLEPQPLLVFPLLFEEKVAAARHRVHKQLLVQARSADLLADAA